ncbi:ABC transporter substrate-binding protein [Rhodococcus erythropolis]|uniref:ABC transporter substrate-binding protein n=1 Tax=Rhodococcus erythropolis TaxID=1833 RepID=UPI0002DFD143|nr:ABC transporter substrate-binding protein [Rhodococcus erythropolis]MCZ4567068.1 ABC transporter substrate-binding protein [Rhodococcus erythropolis]
MKSSIRTAALLCSAVTATAVLTACGNSTADSATSSSEKISVTNCDREVTLPKTAERIVSLYPSMTELLIQLGAADRIVGQSNTDLSPPSPELADQFAAVPVLSTGVPAKEALLDARPDLIVSDGEYWFDGDRLQSMDELRDLGIPIFVNSGYCHKAVTEGRIDDVWSDIDGLGALTGTSDEAATLLADGKKSLAETEASVAGKEPVPTVMVQVSEGQSYALARGLYSSVLEAAGGKNLYESDLPDGKYFGQVATESILAKSPQAILVVYSTESARESTLEAARTAFAGTLAATSNAIFAVPEAWFAGELVSIDGAAEVSRLLHPGS